MKLKKLLLSAMFIAIGIVLPFVTGQIRSIGNMLLPMHIPVILCGFILGWKYGIAVGFILPLLRSLLFSMPVMFPNAVGMAFELATYGGLVGFLYFKTKDKGIKGIYFSLITSMIAGRIVWGFVRALLTGFNGFSFQVFLANGFTSAIPGIILQLIAIPIIIIALKKQKVI